MSAIPVLHVASNGRAVGGVETNLETLLRFHRRDRVLPHVAFMTSGGFSDRIRRLTPAVRVTECRAGRIRHAHKTLRTILSLRNIIRKEDIQVVISHSFHAQIYGGLAARLARRPCLFWVHGLLGTQELRSPLIRLSLQPPAAEIFANSAAVLRSLEEYYRGRRTLRLLYYGIDVRRFAPSRDNAAHRRMLGLPVRSPVIVVPGRLQPWKGQKVVLRAARRVVERFPDSRFLLVGGTTFPADAPYERELSEMIRALHLSGNVTMTGHRQDIRPYLRAAALVVHASIEPEPFGLVLVEGMACGKPVIATRGGGTGDIVDPAYGALYPAGEDRALAKVICTFLADPARLKAMGTRARAAAVSRFSAPRMAEDVENRIESALGQG